MKSKRINKKRKMRSYKRSRNNGRTKRTRRSFIKKKRTQINRRTKRKNKTLKGGFEIKRGYKPGLKKELVRGIYAGDDNAGGILKFIGRPSCILMAHGLAELYGSSIGKFLEIKQKVNDLSFNVGLSNSVKDTLLTNFLEELNRDLNTECSSKDINYYNITEIIELFEAIERGEIKTPKGRDKQSWSEWLSELELFGKNDPKTFNPREPIQKFQPIFTDSE